MKRKIMGVPLWILIVVGLVVFRKKIPIVDQMLTKVTDSMKGMGQKQTT